MTELEKMMLLGTGHADLYEAIKEVFPDAWIESVEFLEKPLDNENT